MSLLQSARPSIACSFTNY